MITSEFNHQYTKLQKKNHLAKILHFYKMIKQKYNLKSPVLNGI
jgi:hypothetical protein